MKRRKFIRNSSLLTASMMLPVAAKAADGWSAGTIAHLIPVVNHDSLLLKVSFVEPQQNPALKIGRNTYGGQKMDTLGRFWSFTASDLESRQQYELSLVNNSGNSFADSWPLTTAPAESDRADNLRVLMYTCAGGPDDAQLENGRWRFQSVANRRRLFQRALSFQPDLAVGIGDQVYWDQTINERRRSPNGNVVRERIWGKYGQFNEDLSVLGSENETILTGCLDEQIAALYGTDFRSVPLILTQDDHDYFENDEGTDDLITFPPRNFSAQLARAEQGLYFPEFLPDVHRPANLAGSRQNGVSESYGSFRWGSLLELLLYDCRRFLSLKGATAVFVEEQAERWLAARTAAEQSARHLIHVPSTPLGWTAGKWGEWYPDYLQPDGQLGTTVPKPYWQSGWFEQHQRILSMLANQQERIPLIISGDLHAIGSGTITASGNLHLDNPVNTILAGPISTGTGWPSAARGIGSSPPLVLEIEERTSPIENNGFTLLDITPDTIDVRQFAWHESQGVARIDSLQPIAEFSLTR